MSNNDKILNEVSQLLRTSDESFEIYNRLKGYLDKNSRSLLVLCGHTNVANRVFDSYAKSYLGERIYKNRRIIEFEDGNVIMVMTLSELLDNNYYRVRGRRFITYIVRSDDYEY